MYISSREFNQRTSYALKMAEQEPVVITNHGKPTFVTMTYEMYQQLSHQKLSALEALTPSPELAEALADIEFELQPRSTGQCRPVDFGEI